MPHPQHVILFVVDGLRPDALSKANAPTIRRLASAGAWTPRATAVFPSISLPCHVSMFCGVPPERHGVLSNIWSPPHPAIPSILDVAAGAGKRTACFYSWEELRDLSRPGSLDFAYYRRRSAPENECDLKVGAAAADHFAADLPELSFVYLGAADEVAHHHGWMSAAYLQAIAAADQATDLVYQAVAAAGCLHKAAFLVLADHGGHEYDHSEGTADDLIVPWIANGAGIRGGRRIAAAVSVIDTAPTVAHLLDLPIPAEWCGRVVEEALDL